MVKITKEESWVLVFVGLIVLASSIFPLFSVLARNQLIFMFLGVGVTLAGFLTMVK